MSSLSYAHQSFASASGISNDAAKVTSARNPISLRLYKVLSTSYDDPATREALRTISDLYRTPEDSRSSSRTAAELNRSASSIGNAPLDDLPGRAHLPAAGIAARARKDFRRDAELKLAQGSQAFLKAFSEVDSRLDVLQTHIDEMRMRCDEAQSHLQQTNQSCRSLLDRASGLRAQRDAVTERQLVVDNFLANFTLTQDEAAALESRDIQIDTQTFQIMRKAEKIREDCRVLMSGEDGPTKAGLDIISETSKQLEGGFEKIARWCSLEFRRFGRDAILEARPLMSEAVKWLIKRPDLLDEALSVLAQTRQSGLLAAFLEALTRGGPGGLPRPIEIHAHDPLRYVGDMLAWLHQSIAGEREFLEGLFNVNGDGRMVGSVRTFVTSEEELWIKNLMDKAFEKLRSPLKGRVRQTIRSQESCIVSYKVANLLSFYNVTMKRTIGDKASLSVTLNEITDEAYQAFIDNIETQARSLARTRLHDEQDLQPPLELLDHLHVLREIMSVYKASLLGDESDEGQRSSMTAVLDTTVNAAVTMCTSVSDARQQQQPSWDKDVFMLNCLTDILSVLQPFSFADIKAREVQKELGFRVESLVTDHYVHILHDSSLYECVQICESDSIDEPLSRIGAMQPQSLAESLRQFANWLSSPDVTSPPRLSRLLDQRLSAEVHRKALQRLASAYERLCMEVRKPENKYEAANTVLGIQRPFGQLSVLWQILGLDDRLS